MDDISSVVEPPSGLDEDPLAQGSRPSVALAEPSAASCCERSLAALAPSRQRNGGSYADYPDQDRSRDLPPGSTHCPVGVPQVTRSHSRTPIAVVMPVKLELRSAEEGGSGQRDSAHDDCECLFQRLEATRGFGDTQFGCV